MIDNGKLVLELFNFKKGLTLEQEDIERVVNYHLGLFNCDETGKVPSQKQIAQSLTEKLKKFSYDNSVVALVESVNAAISEEELFYELDDLYRQLENANQGMVYRHPMQVVLNIINEGTDRDRQIRILNELSNYTWIPAVKNFMFKYTTNPKDRANITSNGGKMKDVYSIVEKVNNGFLTFIGDSWFLFTESSVELTTPSNVISDTDKLKKLVLLEKALRLGAIDGDKIVFTIEEGLDIALSFKGELYLNNEKCDKATTLESIFNSPVVNFMRTDFYPVIAECSNSLDKFVDLDVVKEISNIANPFLECYAFNYKNTMYVYSMDKRYGNSLYQYESATMLVNEMNNQLGFDLSDFYKNKFSKEIQKRKDLENKEKMVLTKISEINENIVKLEMTGLLEVSEPIKVAYEALKEEKEDMEKVLYSIKESLVPVKNIK